MAASSKKNNVGTIATTKLMINLLNYKTKHLYVQKRIMQECVFTII